MQTWQIILISLGSAILLGSTIFLAVDLNNKKQNLTYSKDVINSFVEFNKKFGKTYSDPDFFAYRLGVFSMNAAKVAAHNKKQSTYTMALNKFADMTKEEFVKTYLGLQSKQQTSPFGTYQKTNSTPNSVDWRSQGKVSPIKDQGQCGSCWAFSTTGSLESCSAIFGSDLPSLSEQQLVDCSSDYGNMGCDGGLMDQAFQYVIQNGITSEDNYPYTAETDTCNDSATQDVAFKISSFQDVPSGDCDSLQNAVGQQPVAIGVDAEEWQFYSGGVFSDCGDQLDHGVLAVGYDDSVNWIVKNSWGEGWGESGYITLAAGNTCGICNTASVPSI